MLEAKAREERYKAKEKIELLFTYADVVATRIGYLFTDTKKRKDSQLIQPWNVAPELFGDEEQEAEERQREIAVDKQKAAMDMYAAKWNAYRKAKDDGASLQDGSRN